MLDPINSIAVHACANTNETVNVLYIYVYVQGYLCKIWKGGGREVQ